MKKEFILKGMVVLTMSISGQYAFAQNTKQSAANTTTATHSSDAKGDPSMPTYLVDGVETPYDKVVKLDASKIESMNVYKGPDAIAKFGAKYKHGIVLVKLKKTGKKK